MERVGSMLAYELSKTLGYKSIEINTPLGKKRTNVLVDYPYIITILRAGIPFYQGFLNVFDQSDSGFIGAYRANHGSENSFDIEMGYTAIGNVNDKDVILVDPMIATGRSIVKSIEYICSFGGPRKFHIAALVAAEEGYLHVKKNINIPVSFWFGDLDEELDEKSYIVPGLGDAGDLCFGEKM